MNSDRDIESDTDDEIHVSQNDFCNAIGEETKAMKLAQDTRAQYSRKLLKMKVWMMRNYPDAVEEIDGSNGDAGDATNYRIRVPVEECVLVAFLSHIQLKVDKSTGEYYQPPRFYSFQHVNGFNSAIKHLYRERKVVPSIEVKSALTDTLDGLKRRIAKLKEDGEIPQTEGKQPMSVCGYRFLADRALKQTQDFGLYIFCHTFLLLCWNLIARAVTISSIMYDHISWEEDALTINISRMKNDQEGKHGYARHVYANPDNPGLCPILSLSILIFSKGFQREGSDRLIFGEKKSAKDRFSKWLANILKASAELIVAMGLIISEIGSHSFRKGIASALANNPGGPTAINIWLRAGWSLGPVQSRYIFEGAGGDQFVGRAATGISLSDPAFANLPPHFNNKEDPPLTLEQWELILPGFATFYPESLRVALPYLLASLVFHKNWLVNNLPSNHPLFLQRVWTSGILDELQTRVCTGVLRNEESGMVATGIPPHVSVCQRLDRVESRFDTFENKMNSRFDEMPSKISDNLLNNFEINGAIPLTTSFIGDAISKLRVELVNDLGGGHRGREAPFQSSEASRQQGPDIDGMTYPWGGGIHPVPEGFRFPVGNVRTLWDLWWDGQQAQGIGPYKYIKGVDLVNRKDKCNLTKFSKIMEALTATASTLGLIGPTRRISGMTVSERDDLFGKSYTKLCMDMHRVRLLEDLDKRKIGEMSYVRLYDIMCKTGHPCLGKRNRVR